jgi:hypothetical protein
MCKHGVKRGSIYMAQQLTTEILNAALESLTAKRQQIDEQIAEIRRLLGGKGRESSSASEPTRRKHRISAAGRRAIAEAQKRRWAEQKASAGAALAKKAKAPKRKLSPEGRQAIADAMKKRWAAKKAAAQATERNRARAV